MQEMFAKSPKIFAKNNVAKTCCKTMVQKTVVGNVENQSIILEVSKNICLYDILSNFDASWKTERRIKRSTFKALDFAS